MAVYWTSHLSSPVAHPLAWPSSSSSSSSLGTATAEQRTNNLQPLSSRSLRLEYLLLQLTAHITAVPCVAVETQALFLPGAGLLTLLKLLGAERKYNTYYTGSTTAQGRLRYCATAQLMSTRWMEAYSTSNACSILVSSPPTSSCTQSRERC